MIRNDLIHIILITYQAKYVNNIITSWIKRKDESNLLLKKNTSLRDGLNTNTFNNPCNNHDPILLVPKSPVYGLTIVKIVILKIFSPKTYIELL